MQDYMNIRNQAKQLKNQNCFAEAAMIYGQIYTPKCDKWLAWEYAVVLKKLSLIDEAINISKSLFQRDNSFLYNNNLLSWLIYEKYFKDTKDNYSQSEFKQLYKISLYVSNHFVQDNANAYEKILIKEIKLLRDWSSPQYDKILFLIGKLDVSKLSNESGKYDKDGREENYQSPKEMYYAIKTKALIETKKYDECITYCNEAFTNIQHFHHDNDIWILARKSNCLSSLGNLDDSIDLHNEIILKKKHWSLFHELAKMYLINNDNQNALLYYCRSALTLDPPKMKVGLYFDIAKLLLETSDKENAWKHVVFAKDIRKKENWNIPNNLSQLFSELSIEKFECNNISSALKYFWRKTVCDILGEHRGTISRLNAGGKTGFIQSGNKSYFFKKSSMMEKSQLKQNQAVTFIPVNSFDLKKNKKTIECAYITLDKG